MKSASAAKTPAEYLSSLPEPRRAELKALHGLVRKAAPGLKPKIVAGMIGYGMYKYRYATGRAGEWPRVALCSRKQYISVYICAMDGGRYLAETFRGELPKADIGKSCVRFKSLGDVDAAVLSRLVKKAASAPALGEAAP